MQKVFNGIFPSCFAKQGEENGKYTRQTTVSLSMEDRTTKMDCSKMEIFGFTINKADFYAA